MGALSPASSSADITASALLARPDVRSILQALNANGEEARIVGGAVRDAIMGLPIGDIDIATTALPEAVMAIASDKGWKAVPTGIAHGTVTLVLHGTPYEVTTLRRDVETDGRRAVVAFSRDFREDAFRRDFTINALSLSTDGTVHDYATGIADARAGTVRFMGEAETRIREDYLRILRFFRFFASHGRSPPDREGLKACAANAGGMAQLSRERVQQELLKLLGARGALEAALAMDSIGLWPAILPGFSVVMEELKSFMALEASLGMHSDRILRLAALTASAHGQQEALKLSNAEAQRIFTAHVTASEIIEVPVSPRLARHLIYDAGPDGFRDGLLLAAGTKGWRADLVREALEKSRPLLDNPPINPFRGADLERHGISEGPRMGAILREATRIWLTEDLPESQSRQAAILAEAVQRHPD
jgi:poly(A) polymerase